METRLDRYEGARDNKIQQLHDLIMESKRIVFLGGAGVSTESGIPDFRSTDGLYNQHDVNFERYSPEYLLSHSCLYENTKVFYEFYRQKLNVDGINPNITHYNSTDLNVVHKLQYNPDFPIFLPMGEELPTADTLSKLWNE